MGRLILFLLLVAAGAAFVMRPGPEKVDDALRSALYERLLTAEVDEGRAMLGNAAIVACRLDPSACFEVLRQGLDVTYENRWLYAKVEVAGFGHRAECWGAYGRFWCPGGFEAVEG